MKKFEEKAIPLVFRNENKKYQVNPEAIRFFQNIEGKIAVISVAGIYRTGKSYLLNTILLKQKTGFAVGPTTNPKTKGLWVWGKPLILKNQKDQIINVCVLDSEGLGSIEEDVNHDLRLFSLTLLLSSMFIYNTIGSIDQHAIDSLGLVLKLCERLKAQSYNDFPDFYWVLRDFSLALVGRDNKPLTANKYLEQSLSPQAGDSQIRNKIRQSIRNSFVNRACFTFVRPLTNQQELQKLDTLEIDQLRPQFMEQVIEFRRLVNCNIRTKKIKGKEITADMLVELIKVYTSEINGQDLPQIETGWKYVCARECEQAMAIVEKEAEEATNKLIGALPTTKKELAEKRDAIYEILKKTYQTKTAGNDQASQFQPEINHMLQKLMGRVEEEMRLKNSQETKAFIKREFQNVERRLKGGQFKSMGELAKEFELFYEYYRKKCPYKDEIQTGLETIMKKFSDCSLILFKTIKNRKEQENAKLREQNERLIQELQSKEERHKHQKGLASDKIAVLESKLQELSRQNREISEELSKSEMALQTLKRQHEQGAELANEAAELQVLELRKRLMDAEQSVQQAECSKQFEINNFKNQLLLKDNQINHVIEQNNELSNKISALTNELNFEKEQRGKRIEELINSADSSRIQWEKMRKSFEERLASREQQILRLQSSLQAKAAQLISLTQQHEKTLKALLERHESEKSQLQEVNKEQIKTLKDALQAGEEEGQLRIKKLEGEFVQKQNELKMHRIEMDKEMAVLNQKLEFLRKDCTAKEERITKLQNQNSFYLTVLQEKDNEILNISSILDESRLNTDSLQSQTAAQLQTLKHLTSEKLRQISRLQQIQQQLKTDLRQHQQQIKQLNDQLKMQSKSQQQKLKQLKEQLNWSEEQSEKTKKALEEEVEALKKQNTKGLEEQKKSAELSLIQLKNYYQMERERLEKRNLEERKKHQNLESILSADLEGKHRKAIRSLQEELQSLRVAKDQLEQQFARSESEWQIKVNGLQQQRQNQKRHQINRYEVLDKKFTELQAELDHLELTHQEERVNFVKKIQSLNFELSRKEKELLQANAKKESLEQGIAKKEGQVQTMKKLMNQEIQAALKKQADSQSKYQKINQQYMNYKIGVEKDLALIRQKNEFQASKLDQLSKNKQTGSNKNLEKLDKQRVGDLKDQNQKLKSQVLALQSKVQTQRKASRQQQALSKKQIAGLQRELQCLQQKESINQAKINDLQSRLAIKNQSMMKQVQEVRNKADTERQSTQNQLKEIHDKMIAMEDEKNQLQWKLEKDIALIRDRMKYIEYQRDQAKKELEESEKRLGMATAQLKKSSEKANEDNETRKAQTDKKYQAQIDLLKESLQVKCTDYEDNIRKLKEELKLNKDKLSEQTEKAQALERTSIGERHLLQQNQALRKQKEALIMSHRAERQRESEQWKAKKDELQRKTKQLQKQSSDQMFVVEKELSKWTMQKQNLLQKLKGVEDALEWEKNKSQLVKSKSEIKKTESSSQFNIAEYTKYSSGWK